MKKSLKLTALVLCVVVTIFSTASVFADQMPDMNQPYTYDAENGRFTFTAVSTLGFDTLSAGLFQGAEGMTVEVVIDDPGIRAIGEQAFLNCFRLKKVTIPETVTEIHESAFWGCPTNITIYGVKNSVAEDFADAYGYTFKVKSSDDVSTEGSVSGGVAITILGIGIVFLILIILCLVLKAFEIVFSEKKKPIAKAVAPVPVSAPAEDDTELVAVITAAIAASLNTSTYNLKIKSVRRLGSSWNRAGVQNFNNIF